MTLEHGLGRHSPALDPRPGKVALGRPCESSASKCGVKMERSTRVTDSWFASSFLIFSRPVDILVEPVLQIPDQCPLFDKEHNEHVTLVVLYTDMLFPRTGI